MPATLVQLYLGTIAPADNCVARIAELKGLRVLAVNGLSDTLRELQALAKNPSQPVVLALNGTTAERSAMSTDASQQIVWQEIRALANFFIYGFPQESGAELLGKLCDQPPKTALKLLPAGTLTYQFGESVGKPLGGFSFAVAAAKPVVVFGNPPPNEAKILLTAEGQPVLLSRGHGQGEDYFLSEAPSVSVETFLAPPRHPNDYHGEVLPAAVALQRLFGDHCWRNPFPRACVVIDDPLLQPRYGCFVYDDVLAELEAENYTTTVAFIPSNYRRNNHRVVAQVAAHADQFSVCVHGCDHTGGEFGETNAQSIESKAAIGLANMGKFQKITGLPFDPVMVFPQGVFSSCSLPALKHCGYLAAVNTVPYPEDHAVAPITLANFFDLAITHYNSFPLFTRRYPREVFDFAVDLFWGKPVIVVEHHEYYRDGVGRLTEFIRQLKQLDPRLEWVTLEKVVTQSGHYQLIKPGNYAVKFVTATFQLRNPDAQRAHFECRKPETETKRVENIFVDGKTVPYRLEDGWVCLETDLEPNAQSTITIRYQPCQVHQIRRSRKYQIKAFVRRRLSEFRDNHLSRNQRVLNLAKSLKRLFRA